MGGKPKALVCYVLYMNMIEIIFIYKRQIYFCIVSAN